MDRQILAQSKGECNDDQDNHLVSRAINVNASEADVRSACTAAGVGISTLEPLMSGGTRVVCQTSEGAATLRLKLKRLVIEGVVKRSGLFVAQRVR